MKTIYFCGDTHLNINLNKLYAFSHKVNLDESDYIIHLGDIGICWFPQQNAKELEILDFYNNLGCKILFIPGNHENYSRLFGDEFKEVDIGIHNDVKQISKNVFMLISGKFYTINNKTIFGIRGASSIDKGNRVPNISWWKQETLDIKEYEKHLYASECMKVDFVISHTGTKNFKSKCLGRNSYNDITEDMISNILTKLQYKAHIFGHYHFDLKYIEHKQICLFDKILSENEILSELSNTSNILTRVNDD